MLRQSDAQVFKKYSQMKLQMKREALEKLNRRANEMVPPTAADELLAAPMCTGTGAEMNPLSLLQSVRKLVDVTGIEPATPCLQSKQGKALTALFGVAYTEIYRISALTNVPKLSRSSEQ